MNSVIKLLLQLRLLLVTTFMCGAAVDSHTHLSEDEMPTVPEYTRHTFTLPDMVCGFRADSDYREEHDFNVCVKDCLRRYILKLHRLGLPTDDWDPEYSVDVRDRPNSWVCGPCVQACQERLGSLRYTFHDDRFDAERHPSEGSVTLAFADAPFAPERTTTHFIWPDKDGTQVLLADLPALGFDDDAAAGGRGNTKTR
jgi:hypothetical protein